MIISMLVLLFTLSMSMIAVAQPATYITPFDTVPNFALNPTRTTVQAGPWTGPATWSGGQVPGLTDVVRIIHPVTFSSMTGRALRVGIEAGGSLTFSLIQSTKLDVGTLLVAPGGILEIGTVANPLPPQFTAEIMIRDIPLDTTGFDPAQHGTGLLVLGTITMVDTPRSPAFTRLTTELQANTTTLATQDTVVGWRSGDELVLPDSRQATDAIAQANTWQWETPTLTNAVGQTLTVTPLQFGHPGARSSLTNSLDFTAHVGNLTRNIVVKSENPAGTRGHVWVSRNASVNIQYVRFQDLGRTTIAALSSSNQVGRYAFHAHHLVGPATPIQGYQYVLKGNVVHGGAAQHTRKWAYTFHDAHYGLIEDNIAYNCAGACFMTEEGNETLNLFKHNLAIRAKGDESRDGGGTEATGFWFRGPNNIVKNNVAANMVSDYPGRQNCGYSNWQQYAGNLKIPNYAGADTTVSGQYTLTSAYAMPLKEFSDNEVYASACGMTAWWVGAEYTTPRATQDSVVKNLVAWNIYSFPWIQYQTHRLVFDGFVTRGNPAGISCCNNAYQGGDYFSSDTTMKNSDIQGMDIGIILSTDTLGTQTIMNSRIVSKTTGLLVRTSWTVGSVFELDPRKTVVDNVEFLAIPGSSGWKSIRMAYEPTGSAARSLILSDTVEVKNYQKVSGSNFSAFYPEQISTFIIPQTVASGGYTYIQGSPVAGLTNAQNWSQHAIAIAGAVSPCTDTATRPEIAGFTCASGAPPPPTTSCLMNIPSCPNYPIYAGDYNDTWDNSNNNQARCMQRAPDFYYYCGTTTPVTAKYYSGTTLLQTTIYPDQLPIGNLDHVSCATMYGWAADLDSPSMSIDVHLYDGAGFGGFVASFPTNAPRPDVNAVLGITGTHGYSLPTPAYLKDNQPHTIYPWGINSYGWGPHGTPGGFNVQLSCP